MTVLLVFVFLSLSQALLSTQSKLVCTGRETHAHTCVFLCMLTHIQYKPKEQQGSPVRRNLPKVAVLYLYWAVYSCLFHLTCIRKLYYSDTDTCLLYSKPGLCSNVFTAVQSRLIIAPKRQSITVSHTMQT